MAIINGTTGNDDHVLGGKDLIGTTENDIIHGLFGNDFILGNGGIRDELYGDEGKDFIAAADGGSHLLDGGSENDQLFGANGNDTLNGGSGNDIMDGGDGNDFYIVDSSGDSVGEFAKQGMDSVHSSVSFALSSNIEDLVLAGIANINGSGNELSNFVIGNSGNNTILGGAGNDILTGGGGIDIIDGGTGTNVLSESADVNFTVTPTTLSFGASVDTWTNIQRFDLTGGHSDNKLDAAASKSSRLFGDDGNDQLIGGTGSDLLKGDGGNDQLTGGADNDSFNGGLGLDQIIESGNVNFTLTNTNLTGKGIDTVTNIEAVTLIGGSSNNTIDTTQFNGGVTLRGEAGNDTLKSGKGNDNLDGGSGDDTMQGGDGIDVYTVNSSNDKVVEASATGGLDFVNSSATFALSTNVENLALLGTSNINGTGNSLDNKITGNGFNNTVKGNGGSDTLLGGAGDDTLVGGAGNDTLTGQQGSDRFIFDTGAAFSTVSLGIDSITDFLSADKIVLDKQTFTALKSNAGNGFSVTSEFRIIESEAAAETSGALIVYTRSTGGLFYNQNGAAVGFGTGGKFASVDANTSLNSTGFVIQA